MIDLPRKQESRHCIQCLRCVNPQAKGALEIRLRRPGTEIERIASHHPNVTEVWFLFLGTGVALGGFLWLVLPIYQEWRQMLAVWAIEADLTWLLAPGPAWLMSVHPERREVFLWLDFLMICGFMAGVMAALTALLAVLTAAIARLSGRPFAQVGYLYAPVAMVSLVVGLGGTLFQPLGLWAGPTKAMLFLAGIVWSLWLGWRLMAPCPTLRRLLALLPAAAGVVAIALGWAPALFGV